MLCTIPVNSWWKLTWIRGDSGCMHANSSVLREINFSNCDLQIDRHSGSHSSTQYIFCAGVDDHQWRDQQEQIKKLIEGEEPEEIGC